MTNQQQPTPNPIEALELAKKADPPDILLIRRLALEGAEAEGEKFEREQSEGVAPQDLAITLVSQASLLVDAGQLDHAVTALTQAASYAETEQYQAYIQVELARLEILVTLFKQIADIITDSGRFVRPKHIEPMFSRVGIDAPESLRGFQMWLLGRPPVHLTPAARTRIAAITADEMDRYEFLGALRSQGFSDRATLKPWNIPDVMDAFRSRFSSPDRFDDFVAWLGEGCNPLVMTAIEVALMPPPNQEIIHRCPICGVDAQYQSPTDFMSVARTVQCTCPQRHHWSVMWQPDKNERRGR